MANESRATSLARVSTAVNIEEQVEYFYYKMLTIPIFLKCTLTSIYKYFKVSFHLSKYNCCDRTVVVVPHRSSISSLLSVSQAPPCNNVGSSSCEVTGSSMQSMCCVGGLGFFSQIHSTRITCSNQIIQQANTNTKRLQNRLN